MAFDIGILGSGGQADEAESYLSGGVKAIFRAVNKEYLSNDKPFLIAVSPHYTSWFKKIRSTSLSNSFTAKLPCKIPADLYDVSLCWYEDKIPKSMLVAKNHQISCGVR